MKSAPFNYNFTRETKNTLTFCCFEFFCPLSTWLTGGDDDPTAWNKSLGPRMNFLIGEEIALNSILLLMSLSDRDN